MDENPIGSPELIDAGKGAAVLSVFEEIDIIALALIQHEAFNNRQLTLAVEDFCKETLLFKNTKDKSISADFGEGCISSKGVRREGVIKVVNSNNFWSNGNETQIILDNFYIDGVKVSGTRILTNRGYVHNSRQLKLESVMNRVMVMWPSEEALSIACLHNKTINLPTVESGFIFSVTGKSEMKDRKGTSLVAEIVKPMVFKQDCTHQGLPSPTSGSMEIKRSQSEAIVVNFNEACK
jgi:hypothetical protein